MVLIQQSLEELAIVKQLLNELMLKRNQFHTELQELN